MGLSEPPLRPSRRPSRLKNPPSVTAARVGFGPRAPSQLSAKRWADGNNMQPRTLVFVLVCCAVPCYGDRDTYRNREPPVMLTEQSAE